MEGVFLLSRYAVKRWHFLPTVPLLRPFTLKCFKAATTALLLSAGMSADEIVVGSNACFFDAVAVVETVVAVVVTHAVAVVELEATVVVEAEVVVIMESAHSVGVVGAATAVVAGVEVTACCWRNADSRARCPLAVSDGNLTVKW